MSWGGKREGAGRPKSSLMVSHLKRPRVGSRRPVKVTLKIRRDLPTLRQETIFEVFERACLRARRFGLRIIHFAVLDHKILLICEFKKQEQLEKSFKSLNTSLAIALKKEYQASKGLKHEGPVFLGRFEMELLDDPEQARIAIRDLYLAYSFDAKKDRSPDAYSSAPIFNEWQLLLKEENHANFESTEFNDGIKERVRRMTSLPQFWLTHASWKGLPQFESIEEEDLDPNETHEIPHRSMELAQTSPGKTQNSQKAPPVSKISTNVEKFS